MPLGWLFNVYIKKRYLAWWSKYAYLLTTGFYVGIAISGIIQFIFSNADRTFPEWWGTECVLTYFDAVPLTLIAARPSSAARAPAAARASRFPTTRKLRSLGNRNSIQ